MSEKKAFSRLPTDVRPLNYVISLKPDLDKFTFVGNEDVTIEVKTSTKSIVLNCAEITVSEAKYKSGHQSFDHDVKISISDEDETLTLEFPELLQAGEGVLSLSFAGQLNDRMKGFYRCKYTTSDGEVRYGASTQFEATEARRSFPCWDEPAIKATFDVTLVVPSGRVALSNMPVTSESSRESDPGCNVVKFQRTPIMPTYLVAFVVGEYDYVEAHDTDGILVRVYTPVGKKQQGQFALDVAVRTLPFYKNYFNVAYPLPKMDLIAVADFAGGAMENWGLITYRETALLIDDSNSSASSRQTVALVVGHEIAHMWFGNLVTMEWWTNLWLKEGFASWIEYLCVDHCFPEFDIWTQFATSDFTRALDLDALRSSHPIEVPVGHPSEIDEIFDLISYSKGASVIRMLHSYIGDEDFRKGMNIYLTRHQYSNTTTEDLWSALAETSGKPIEAIMNTWTKQMGFPVIKVTQVIKGEKRIVTLKQEKFTADGSKDEKNQTWMVPITICSASSPDTSIHSFILDKQEETIEVDKVSEKDWLKLNVGGVGFYRTLYPPEMLSQLLPGIKDKTLSPRDRLGLQNDFFALTRAGVAEAVDVLKVVEAFETETNFTVWADLNGNLAALAVLYQYTDFYGQFQTFLCKLFSPVFEGLGWDAKEGEGPLVAMLRSLVIGRLGRAGDKSVIEEAKKRFAAHANGEVKLIADLRQAVYSIVLRHGGAHEFEEVLKLYQSTDLQEERGRILRSLGATTDPTLIQKTLDFSIGTEVRSQDTVSVIVGVTGSVEGRELAWKFVKDQFSVLHGRYRGGFLLSRLIKSTTENFVTEEKAVEIEQFFHDNPAPAAERNIQQSLENIRLNAKQLNRDRDAVKKFLSTRG